MDLIFWLESVPVCCKGIFDATAMLWKKGKVFYFCYGNISNERKKIISQNDCGSNSEVIYIYLLEQKNTDLFLSQFIKEHRDDIHVFNGYRSIIFKKFVAEYPKEKTFVWAERPCPPQWKEKYPWALFHVLFALKYRSKVSAMLPLGHKGVDCYAHYGWPREKLYPFLYLPLMNELLPKKNKRNTNDKVHFVYLGRFSKGSKGIDILMKAFQYIKNKDFTLDMVGGYGDYLNETLEWIKKTDNVKFLGTWPIKEACDRLYNYDVCIIPSKYEGWNVTLNEALMAGIGCIATDECVSDEMIKTSGAGKIVHAGDAKSLALAMDEVVANPVIIDDWNKKAYNYRCKMTAKTCAAYLIEILTSQKLPNEIKVPWLS